MIRWELFAIALVLMARAEASFFPEEGPAVPIRSAKHSKNVDEVAAGLSFFESQMAPVVLAHGGLLRLVLESDDPKVNARALREEQNWLIVVYGGLAHHANLTQAELMLVLCHELGHHLGGAPTAARNGWSACEGQADYWSALSCFKTLRPTDDAAQVALNLTRLYASMTITQTSVQWPDLSCRENTRPSRTVYGYPSPQCRLDTLMAGFMGEGRPACWFVAE